MGFDFFAGWQWLLAAIIIPSFLIGMGVGAWVF